MPTNTSVKNYHSAMLGAPVLSGTPGSGIAVLDILINGFGLQSVPSITVAGGIATMPLPNGHSFEPDVVAIVSGVSLAALNGEWRILSTTVNSATFAAPGIADQTATGTITAKVAGAGWEKVFSSTNLAAYRSADVESTRMFLRVDDTGTTNARTISYESMTDISTGVGRTPLDSQIAGGLYWPKSSTASATARDWFLVADGRGFYLAVAPAGGDRYTLLFAGDTKSLKSGDAYGFLLTGNQSDQTNTNSVPDGCMGYSHRSARSGAYIARSHTAIGQSTAAQRLGAHHNGSTADNYAGVAGYSVGTYPNGPNNGLITGELELYAAGGIRGAAPGLLHPVQDCGNAFSTGAKVAGTDDLAGRLLMAIRTGPPSSGAVGTVFLDVTGPWSR